jgi:hypothetical protein
METTTKEQEIEKTIIETCIKIGRRGEGSIVVLGEAKYNPMVEQKIIPFNIVDNPKLLKRTKHQFFNSSTYGN